MGQLPQRSGGETVVDVGCGPGIQLATFVETGDRTNSFIGVEPAEGLRNGATERVKRFPNARVYEGKFEDLPLDSNSVDYLYSIFAFHWVSDINQSAAELARVLKDTGEMDLFFSGKFTGKEFNTKTTPVYFKFLTPKLMMEAAKSQQKLTVDDIDKAFRPLFGARELTVAESYHTYYDSLEGHWSWRCRVEGLVPVPEEKKAAYDEAVKAALATLETDQGIPFTVHLLHVKLRR
jgi:ubiquinone/menaquinone biosynthesis C-methylase UbiE